MTNQEEQELLDWHREKHGITDAEPSPKPQVLQMNKANSSGEALADVVAAEVKSIILALLTPIVRRIEGLERDVGTLPRVARELRASIDRFHGDDVETRIGSIERRLHEVETKK